MRFGYGIARNHVPEAGLALIFYQGDALDVGIG